MKILYAIQGTGNGHLSRARDIVPRLLEYANVELLLSGTQSQVRFPYPFKYRFKGISFRYNRRGGIAYAGSAASGFSSRIMHQVRHLSLSEYDLVINDFEPVSAWAAQMQKVPCVGLGHQAAFMSNRVPRPARKEKFGEWILRNYAPVNDAFGFHFQSYDKNIFTPVIRPQIRALDPYNDGHYTVYLPAVSNNRLLQLLSQIPEVEWQVFSRQTKVKSRINNIWFHPIDNQAFIQSLESCEGLLTGAGFEGPSEAMYLGKKLFVIPIKGQYEQQCNAAAMRRMGIPVANSFNVKALERIRDWVWTGHAVEVDYPDQTNMILESLLAYHQNRRELSTLLSAL